MKQCIKEVISQLAFPKTMILTPPPKKIQTKGATKKVRSTPNEASTSQIPSLQGVMIFNFPMVKTIMGMNAGTIILVLSALHSPHIYKNIIVILCRTKIN